MAKDIQKVVKTLLGNLGCEWEIEILKHLGYSHNYVTVKKDGDFVMRKSIHGRADVMLNSIAVGLIRYGQKIERARIKESINKHFDELI